MDSNIPVISALYFCCLVFFGSFFIVNLILAVIMEKFEIVDQQYLMEKETKAKEALSKSASSSMALQESRGAG